MNQKQMKKKTVKGMTLVEVIIALFVFVVASALMVNIGSAINTHFQNSNHVNRKVAIEAPLAENGSNIAQKTDDGTGNRKLEAVTSNVRKVNSNMKVTVTMGSKQVSVTGTSFSTAPAVAGNELASTDADLQFIDIDLTLNKKQNIWKDTE